MNDLISRQAAIDALCGDYCGGWQDCKHYPNCENLRAIQKLPSAQPGIIRCNSCRHDNNCAIQDVAQTGGKFFCGFAKQKGEQP